MKKIFINIVFLFCFVNCCKVYAQDYNGYIVKLNNEVFTLMSHANALEHIADDLYLADSIEDIYSCTAPENIESVFPNYRFELFEIDFPEVPSDTKFSEQWYLEKTGAVSAREKGISGKGVKIAIIDSGINSLHPDLKQTNILPGYNCVPGASDTNDCSDSVGHGTMVAGIIAAQTDNELAISGISPDVTIIPIKITDTTTFDFANIFAGLNYALQTDCDIINMSLGGRITNSDALKEFKSYIDKAEEKGITVVAAVGNSGHTNNYMNYPAGFEGVIGVGSVNENLSVSYFSQRNNSVFVSAPGNGILTLSKDGQTTSGMGTSMATPCVSGAIALIKQLNPDASPHEIRSILKDTSVDCGSEGYDINYGYGILNIKNILNKMENRIPELVVSEGMKDSQIRLHIHNNSQEMSLMAYFAGYSGSELTNLKVIDSLHLKNGVTTIVPDDGYEKFLLWDYGLRPVVRVCCIDND